MENTEKAGIWFRRFDTLLEMQGEFYDEDTQPIQGYDAEREALETSMQLLLDEVGRQGLLPAFNRLSSEHTENEVARVSELIGELTDNA